jgi:cytochrome c551/c552
MGKHCFQSNCASCHNPLKDATGPALKGADARVPSKEWLHNWVHNSSKVVASGDKYANEIFNKWGKTVMTPFPGVERRGHRCHLYLCKLGRAGYQPQASRQGAKQLHLRQRTTIAGCIHGYHYYIISARYHSLAR